MNVVTPSAAKVCGSAVIVIIPLVAAAWLPPSFPNLLRQVLLSVWGVGAILVAERWLFSDTFFEALRSVGFVRARRAMVVVALLASLPMWAVLPLFAWGQGAVVGVRPDWFQLLIGVVLVNGITEEVIHRGYVFGHLRRGRSLATATTLSALIFAAQHLYIVLTAGVTIGLASVMRAAPVRASCPAFANRLPTDPLCLRGAGAPRSKE